MSLQPAHVTPIAVDVDVKPGPEASAAVPAPAHPAADVSSQAKPSPAPAPADVARAPETTDFGPGAATMALAEQGESWRAPRVPKKRRCAATAAARHFLSRPHPPTPTPHLPQTDVLAPGAPRAASAPAVGPVRALPQVARTVRVVAHCSADPLSAAGLGGGYGGGAAGDDGGVHGHGLCPVLGVPGAAPAPAHAQPRTRTLTPVPPAQLYTAIDTTTETALEEAVVEMMVGPPPGGSTPSPMAASPNPALPTPQPSPLAALRRRMHWRTMQWRARHSSTRPVRPPFAPPRAVALLTHRTPIPASPNHALSPERARDGACSVRSACQTPLPIRRPTLHLRPRLQRLLHLRRLLCRRPKGGHGVVSAGQHLHQR